MLFAEAIETVKCLDEGVIESVADANIGSIFGIGFPGWTGGVLQYINGYDGGVAGFVAARPRARRRPTASASSRRPRWSRRPSAARSSTFATSTPWNASDIGCGDLTPTIGVTATPVIDPTTNIAYLTHKTYVSGNSGPARWYMDAVDMATGAEEPGFPVAMSGAAQNAPGQRFEATTELQRPGLLLMEGVVYAAFGSDCDIPPWQGWVFGVSTAGVVKARWVADQTGYGAGIWQSGAGLTSDGPGTILLSTGNGGAPSTPTPGNAPPANLGESVVRLRVQSDGSLQPVDFFAPFDATSLDSWDADFASGGVTGLPEASFGTPAIPHLAVAVGKDGYVYLLNRDDLGGIGQGPSGADDVVQRIGPYGGVWSRPGVWPGEGGWVYIPTASGGTSSGGSSGNLRVYAYGTSGTGSPTLSLRGTSSDAFGFSSSAPVITSNGTAPGSALVWVVWAPNGSGSGAQLRAYDPIPVAGSPVLRWSAPVGTSSKFALPGVGAGRLYVGTRDGHVLAFGSPVTAVLSGSPAVFPTTTIGESSEQTLTLTATEALTLSSLESSSPQFTLGAPSIALPATLSSGQEIQVPITFTPTATGPAGATLTAQTATGKTAAFSLSGVGQAAAAKLEVVPPLVTFGGTTVGTSLSAGATFRNVGAVPLEIEAVHLPGAPFSATGVPAIGSKIAPGGSVTITVAFEPSAIGTFEGQIGLDTSGGNEAVGLTGSAGLPGALQFSSETSDYGNVPVGSSATTTFTITNVGGTNVTITKSKPPSGGAFQATTSLSEGTTIEPGASVTETVAFTPTAAGEASGAWAINADDTTGLHEVRFTGVGAPPQESSLLQATLPRQGALPFQQHEAPPVAKLASTVLTASRTGYLHVRISCPAGETRCAGRITLRTLAAVRAATGATLDATTARILTLATRPFSIAGGRSIVITLRLTPEARARLARLHVLRAQATILAHDPAGVAHTTRTVLTIHQAKVTHRR
jgi:hypothetical protein